MKVVCVKKVGTLEEGKNYTVGNIYVADDHSGNDMVMVYIVEDECGYPWANFKAL